MQKLPQGSSRVVEIFQHVHAIRFYVSERRGSGELIFHPPSLTALGLYECSCGNTGEFHRLNNPRRNKLEKAIVQRLVAIHSDKNDPVHLLSMGSGGLMSDFITLEKLILKGFKSILIDCVDPMEIDPKKIEGIREFFSKCSGISVDIHAYKNIKEVRREKENYSAVLAVDYDALASFSWENCLNALADLVRARSLLNKNGFLALGFNSDDTLSGKTMETITLTSSSLIESLTSDLIQQLKQKNELLLVLPSFKFAGAAHLLLYALSIAIEKSEKRYDKILISSLSKDIITPEDWKKQERQAFEIMSQVLFPNTEIEICCHEQGKKYDLLFTGSKEEEFATYSTLLNEEAIAYIIYPQGAIYRQNSNQKNESIQVFSGNEG
ncbi:MAG TPA: hypothetical protein VGZ69_03415 [Candidatus Rhabdochlamydia sp.]|jgi:hypothetical protein|nr:hypothetical protein [Candidatus Rhabdochlamydia sp.]